MRAREFLRDEVYPAGWVWVRTSGSHRTLRRGREQRVFAFLPQVDLGQSTLEKLRKEFGVMPRRRRKRA